MIPTQKGLQAMLIVRAEDVPSTLVELYANHAGRCADAVLEVARYAGRVVLAAVYLGDDNPDGEEADAILDWGIPEPLRAMVGDLASYSGQQSNPLVRKYDEPFPLNGSVPTWCGLLNDLEASARDRADIRAALEQRAAWRDTHAGAVLLAGPDMCNDCGHPVRYEDDQGWYIHCEPGHCCFLVGPDGEGPGWNIKPEEGAK